jgi:lipopolysaccharide transport system ATP-binding protein
MSSSDIAISVRGLGKAYEIRRGVEQHITLTEQALSRLRHPLRRQASETFWALRDVDADIARGQVTALVGRNGAGKSTLLKVLSRITAPTTGRVEVDGRIGSLLEVGTGFHPELTGRENIFLNGSILGMTRAEVKRQFDAIVDFAGVEAFLDMPVKRYSSGMYVRLAFAVASHLDTEILIVDEVLAVGDQDFQRQCLGKLGTIANDGRTVVLVSHNMGVVKQIAHQALLLRDGRAISMGSVEDAIAGYVHQTATGDDFQTFTDKDRWDLHLAREVELVSGRMGGHPAGFFDAADDITFDLNLRANESVEALRVSLTLSASSGEPVGTTFSESFTSPARGETAGITIRIPDLALAPGRYHLAVATGVGDASTGHRDFDVITNALAFEVAPGAGANGAFEHWQGHWGRVRINPLIVQQGVTEHARLTL